MERKVILGPTTEKQRFIILDALRGLALLGICLANLPEFSLWTFLSGEEQAAMPTAAVDRVVRFLLAYMTGLCLLMLRCPHLLLFRLLAKPGRVALTNYISQSIAGIILYYGIGFGMGLDMGLWQVELTAIGIFVAQIICSHVWMKWFKYGPLEWVWRMLTYGRWLDIRK